MFTLILAGRDVSVEDSEFSCQNFQMLVHSTIGVCLRPLVSSFKFKMFFKYLFLIHLLNEETMTSNSSSLSISASASSVAIACANFLESLFFLNLLNFLVLIFCCNCSCMSPCSCSDSLEMVLC